ncbi:MAG: hypothetical protein AMXMBFR4_34510 [Candidatus Hydrogenedentota bacterium]
MKHTTRFAIFTAMCLFTVVSIWTTYKSLYDSILPGPTFTVQFSPESVYKIAWPALGLSVAIGLMLFALKLAIIDGQKRLNVAGVIGLIVIAFISISFNMDVLYRTADRDFFLRYSDSKVRSAYETYLAQVQGTLSGRRSELLKQIAKQEGELESEIRGLREKPAGYGSEARKEEYQLTLLEKEAQVELESIDQALAKKGEADALLNGTIVASLDDVHMLQEKLRVLVKDLAGTANVALPPPVKLETPFFAVFDKLFDFRNAGPMEILILLLAFLLDLGDIIGYSLIPNKPDKVRRTAFAIVPEHLPGPEVVHQPRRDVAFEWEPAAVGAETKLGPESEEERAIARPSLRRRRSFRFRR